MYVVLKLKFIFKFRLRRTFNTSSSNTGSRLEPLCWSAFVPSYHFVKYGHECHGQYNICFEEKGPTPQREP